MEIHPESGTAPSWPGRQTARDRLAIAVVDLDLTDPERRTLAWMTRWDPETVENVASVIEKARRAS